MVAAAAAPVGVAIGAVAAVAAAAVPVANSQTKSAAAASNEVAAGTAPQAPRTPMPARPVEGVELLWWQPSCASRLWRVARWRPLLDELQARLQEGEAAAAPATADAPSASARRAVLEVLAQAPCSDAAGLAGAWDGALRSDGRFVAPLVTVAGELESTFDDLEMLKATLAAVAAIPRRETLGSVVAVARELLATPGADSASGIPAELVMHIQQAVVSSEGGLRGADLERRVLRSLLEGRHYQQRRILGEVHLRALLHMGMPEPVVAYVPSAARDLLPLFQRFRVRLLAELCPQQDENEATPSALRVLALGRLVSRR